MGKYQDFAGDLEKKTMGHEGNSHTNNHQSSCNSLQEPRKETRTAGDQRNNRDYSDHSTVEINKNTEKSPGKPSRLPVT